MKGDTECISLHSTHHSSATPGSCLALDYSRFLLTIGPLHMLFQIPPLQGGFPRFPQA